MRRTAFKLRAPQLAQRDPDRVRSVPAVTPGAFRRAIEDKHQGFSRYATDAEVQAYRQAI